MAEFFGNLLISFREILEMVLIVGIILVVLNKTEQKQWTKFVWAGVLAGIIGSLIIAGVLSTAVADVRAVSEEITEGVTALLAAGVITYVIFWLGHKNVKQHLQDKVQKALSHEQENFQKLGLFALSFFAVLREGFELVLLVVLTTANAMDIEVITAIALGGIIALVLGFILFKTAVHMNLQTVFKITTIFLALFAAGLVVTGLHELAEAHVIPEMPIVIDVSSVLNHKTDLLGQMLNTLFGYRAKLTGLEIGSYIGYLALVYVFYQR